MRLCYKSDLHHVADHLGQSTNEHDQHPPLAVVEELYEMHKGSKRKHREHDDGRSQVGEVPIQRELGPFLQEDLRQQAPPIHVERQRCGAR